MADVIETFANGKVIERDFTKAELEQIEIDKKVNQEMETKAEAKAIAKAAILDRLGLTADEFQTILG